MNKRRFPIPIFLLAGLLMAVPAWAGVYKRYKSPVQDAVNWHGTVTLAEIQDRTFHPAVFAELGSELREYTLLKLKVIQAEGKTALAPNSIIYAGFLGGNKIYGNSAAPPLSETVPGKTIMVFLAPASPYPEVTGSILWIHNSAALYQADKNRSGAYIVKSKGGGSAFPQNAAAGPFLSSARAYAQTLKQENK